MLIKVFSIKVGLFSLIRKWEIVDLLFAAAVVSDLFYESTIYK